MGASSLCLFGISVCKLIISVFFHFFSQRDDSTLSVPVSVQFETDGDGEPYSDGVAVLHAGSPVGHVEVAGHELFSCYLL